MVSSARIECAVEELPRPLCVWQFLLGVRYNGRLTSLHRPGEYNTMINDGYHGCLNCRPNGDENPRCKLFKKLKDVPDGSELARVVMSSGSDIYIG